MPHYTLSRKMQASQHCTLTLDTVHQYFAQLNPLAQRIACDISDTKSTYGQLWCTLSSNEQNDIINETLIKPEISLKYFDNFSISTAAERVTSTSPSATSTLSTPSRCSARSAAHILQRRSCGTTSSAIGASAESLTTTVLKNTPSLLSALPTTLQPQQQHLRLKAPTEPPPPPPVAAKPRAVEGSEKLQPACNRACMAITKPKPMRDIQNCYAYDGRNVRTYALQKVALKIIHDDILGTYRDEHSFPFSYRTKSQINLLQQQHWNANSSSTTQLAGGAVCLLNDGSDGRFIVDQLLQPVAAAVRNYSKLQSEFKHSLYNQLEKNKYADTNSCKRPENALKPVNSADGKLAPKQPMNGASTDMMALTGVGVRASNGNGRGDGNIVVQHDIKNEATHNINTNGGATIAAQLNYAVYTDAFYEHGERSYLMQNCSNSSILTASSSSATTSDDDERNNYEVYDEKTLCEDVMLLDNDMNLRKGFDFLNNW